MKAKKSKSAPKANYDAAKARRRLAGWNPSTASARAIIASDGAAMRARARDIVRNNPYAASGCESFVANLIGTGIKPSSLISDAQTRKAVQEVWNDWTDECDADGVNDFYGIQSMIAQAIFESGECFVRFRSRFPGDVQTVPLQLQLLEADMLDLTHNEELTNGNKIVSGVEFDRIGRRVAYWFWTAHPGEASVSDMRRGDGRGKMRVPADAVLHIANLKRPGQVRGVPIAAPAVVKLWLLDQYDDAELDRKKTAAMYAGFITSPKPEELFDEDQAVADNEGVVSLEPGTMQALLPGESVEFSAPADVGASYEAFQYRNLLAACVAMGVPYMSATGDVSRANYSSIRAAIVEFRRRLERIQHQIIVFQFCRPVWMRWLTEGVVSGALSIPGFASDRMRLSRAKWIPPRWEWVDPAKDIGAEIEAVNAGFKARSDVIEGMGEDPEAVDDRIAADHAREEQLGLDFSAKPSSPVHMEQDQDDPQEPEEEDGSADDAAA